MTDQTKKTADVIDVQSPMDHFDGNPDSDKITADFIDAPVSMINEADLSKLSHSNPKAETSTEDFIDVQASMDHFDGNPDSDKITEDFIDAPVSMINEADFAKLMKKDKK